MLHLILHFIYSSSGKYCNQSFPNSNSDKFHHQTRANLAQVKRFYLLYILIIIIYYL